MKKKTKKQKTMKHQFDSLKLHVVWEVLSYLPPLGVDMTQGQFF